MLRGFSDSGGDLADCLLLLLVRLECRGILCCVCVLCVLCVVCCVLCVVCCVLCVVCCALCVAVYAFGI